MKNRLIEILQKKYDHFCDQCGVNKDSHYTESLADYLLANGVIVPPVKVGQTVYQLWIKRVIPRIVTRIESATVLNGVKGTGFLVHAKSMIRDNWYMFYLDDIGKTIFLTKEEAEQALAERSKE